MKIFYLRQLKTANLHLETAIACQSCFNPPRQASRPVTRTLFLPCPHAGAWADDASDGGYSKVSHLEMSLTKVPDTRNPNTETYPKN